MVFRAAPLAPSSEWTAASPQLGDLSMRVPVRVMASAVAGLLAVGVSACGSSSGGSGQAEANGPVTLRIAHNSNAAGLPARVAEAQGFFKKHDLNVKFT